MKNHTPPHPLLTTHTKAASNAKTGHQMRPMVAQRAKGEDNLTCSSTTFRVGPGKGPHIAELICTGCERGGRWLSKADAVTMGVAA